MAKFSEPCFGTEFLLPPLEVPKLRVRSERKAGAYAEGATKNRATTDVHPLRPEADQLRRPGCSLGWINRRRWPSRAGSTAARAVRSATFANRQTSSGRAGRQAAECRNYSQLRQGVPVLHPSFVRFWTPLFFPPLTLGLGSVLVAAAAVSRPERPSLSSAGGLCAAAAAELVPGGESGTA